MDSLVSTDWLARHIDDDDLVVLDASKHMPGAGRDPRAEFEARHIPGARYLDMPTLHDAGATVANTLPTAEQFAERMRTRGIERFIRIVLYDDSAIRSAARAWFLFRMFGHHEVAILDGGLAKWVAEGRPAESGAVEVGPSQYDTPEPSAEVRDKTAMLANIDSQAEQVIDARDAERFQGLVDDRVHGLEGGHIPGARNLFFKDLFEEDGTYKSRGRLRAAFEQAGIDLDQPIAASCGSGMTASVVLFALHLLGRDDAALYDGSWAEWGADPATPKATGAA